MSIQPFSPRTLPNIPIKWERLIEPIAEAHAMVARFDELLEITPNSRKIFAILRTREAIWSMESQKGKHLHVSMTEILEFEGCSLNHSDKEKRVKEIIVNRNALDWASSKSTQGPISCNLLRQIHHLLKKDSNAAKCDIGRFRNRQNWIGPIGCNIEDAYFYPPPAHVINAAMANWEKYVHSKQNDPLVQLAVLFAQLLIVHPFMDGNGRISRLLIPIFLNKKGLVSKPLFFMSRYFQKHRLKYLENLHKTSMENQWEDWIRFFLTGIVREAEDNIKRMKKILKLRASLIKDHPSFESFIDSLFAHPAIKKEVLLKNKTSRSLMAKLESQKIICIKGDCVLFDALIRLVDK